MVVFKQFYEVIEADTRQISVLWKATHLFLFLVAAVSGFTAAFCFGGAYRDLSYNCIIGAEVSFSNNTLPDGPPAIDLTLTIWGTTSVCNYVQCSPIMSMICAVVWGVFFALISKGGAGYGNDILDKPWRIVPPCIVVSIILSIIQFSSSSCLSQGLKDFCEQLFQDRCNEQMDIYTTQFRAGRQHHLFLNTQIANYCSHIGAYAWLAQLAILLFRVICVTDFDVVLVTIREKDKLEKVVTYDEDDDLYIISNSNSSSSSLHSAQL